MGSPTLGEHLEDDERRERAQEHELRSASLRRDAEVEPRGATFPILQPPAIQKVPAPLPRAGGPRRSASFMGVPIVGGDGVVGAFYLTDKEGDAEFTAADQELIEMLAPHAALAMENARLSERSRELSIVEERNRLARDLHDSLVQKLFGVVLAAKSASPLLERDAVGARAQVDRLGELAQDAISELRSLVFQLRPAAIETEGLAEALRKHVEVLRRRPAGEVWGEGRLDVIDEIFTDPIVRHHRTGTETTTRADYARTLSELQRILCRPETTIEDCAVVGDRVWTRATSRGLNKELGEMSTVTWLIIQRLDGDRIAEQWVITTNDVDWRPRGRS
jgi:hypothetical protein